MLQNAHHRAAVRGRLLQSGLRPPGPASVSWKLNREVVVIAGWGRAILLQLAHPSVAAGVHDHSQFRGSLMSGMKRLQSTVGAMLKITFGDTEERVAAAAGINAVHDHVQARDGSGETYSAHDPALQRWVHCTLLESIPLTYELLVGPLTRSELDQYCRESTIMEPLLGMPEGSLPRGADQLNTYMRDMLAGGSLRVSDRSRALAHAVLYPPTWRVAWPAFRASQLLTIGLLPPSIRAAYGFTWGVREERAFARWVTLLRGARQVLPRAMREWAMARREPVAVAAVDGG